MAKITIADIGADYASVVGLNNRFQQIEDFLNDNVLCRGFSGTEPNEMNVDLDMNNYQIINLPAPASDYAPARLIDIKDLALNGDGALYTTTAQLDAGYLDTRYYTETEVDALIAGIVTPDVYTKAELNAGQLDNRYYTEAEVDAAIAAAVAAVSPWSTGDFRHSSNGDYSTTEWLHSDGRTIGNGASNADHTGEIYRDLYRYMWVGNFAAIVYTSGGVVTGKGVSADIDFDAGKRITLPDFRAAFMCGVDGTGFIDLPRQLLSFQDSHNKFHNHGVEMGSDINSPIPAAAGAACASSAYAPSGIVGSVQLTGEGGTHTVPRNFAVYVYIKV